MIDDTLSRTVIGCAMEVHRELGPGYLEKVYENALAIALSDAGINVAQQVATPAQFRGKVVGDFVADLLVEGKLIVELKAVSHLLPAHETQLVSYLKSTGMEVGLLINFGAGSLQFKRKYRTYRPPAVVSEDRITGVSGFTGGPSPLHVHPVNPETLSASPEQGGARFSKNNPVHPANPEILSASSEQDGARSSKINPVHPANPEILSTNGAWQ